MGIFAIVREYFKNLIFIFIEMKSIKNFLLIKFFLIILVISSFPALNQFFLKKIIAELENVFYSNTSNINYALAFLVLYSISGTIIYLAENAKFVLTRELSAALIYNLQNKIIKKVKTLPFCLFDKDWFQDLHSETITRCNSEPAYIVNTILPVISNLMSSIIYFSILISFSKFITCLMLFSVLPFQICKLKYQGYFFKILKNNSRKGRYSNYCYSVLTSRDNFKEVKLMNLYPYFSFFREKIYSINIKNIQNHNKKEVLYTLLAYILSQIIFFSVTAYWLFNLSFSVSNYIYILGISSSFYSSLTNLSIAVSLNYNSTLFLNDLLAFLNLDYAEKNGNFVLKKGAKHIIEFCNVSFKYTGSDKWILKNINLKIITGDRVCIIGENGSGKSTILDLLLRIYKPTSGKICIDGKDIYDYDSESYGLLFATIFQNYGKYSVTISDYLNFGRNNFKDGFSKVVLKDFILEMKYKFNSDLTKRFNSCGEELSGGQWQKLAVNRVFYSDADILVFDEPTSAIDLRSVEKIYDTIGTIDDKICLLVSHDLDILKKMTKIILLKDGEIAFNGDYNRFNLEKAMLL